jgi:predicted short-subunit dehydrogenase-like oxidoreductase (DUF2520 family)
MNIVIIGSGNVATVVGRRIHAAGHPIVQVFSRRPDQAANLATVLQAKPISSLSEMERTADLILLAIPDNAYTAFVREFPSTHAFVIHTAGSVPMDVLKNISPRYGVLYPLQSLRKELKTIPEFPLLIDADDPMHLQELKTFATGLSKTVIQANDETRLKYHLGAVLVNNFVNHLFAITEAWCRKEQIAFSLLAPLIEETVTRLGQISSTDMQTGPAIRNDIQTLEKHRELLKQDPELLHLYEILTRSIQHFHGDNLKI